MLEKYKDTQKNAYNLFNNQLNLNQISHAYLLDDNNSNDSFDIVISFIKAILCNKKDFCKNFDECNICSLVDSNSYPELKIIKPDGMYIKKSQLFELQEDFSKSSVYGDKKIYIILDADKMRLESANAILKFLEEPSSDIIAFLITNNFNNMIPTIVSRCQIIKLNNNNSYNNSNLDDLCLNFIKSMENDKYNTFLNQKSLIFDNIDCKNRDEVLLFIDNLISIYYDILKIVNGSSDISYDKYYEDLLLISKLNTLEKIINKINFLIDMKDSVKFNVNVNLLFDSIIFTVGGCYEYCRC